MCGALGGHHGGRTAARGADVGGLGSLHRGGDRRCEEKRMRSNARRNVWRAKGVVTAT